MVKARVTNLLKDPKQGFNVLTIFIVTFNAKIISMKCIFTSNLSLINP